MTTLADIDRNLNACRSGLRTKPQDRADILVLIDDLLDQRLELDPPKHRFTPATKACSLCYKPRPILLVPPRAEGARTVEFIDCPTCDRSRCKCGAEVLDRTAKRCPVGHWLDRG